jgi:hypothetical protein
MNELSQELDREIKINLENEAKIRRFECRQASYEEEIKYLYGVIENLESQKCQFEKDLHSLNDQLAESNKQLEKNKKLSDEREEFIVFRESQLEELEDTVNKLKQQISLSNRMSEPDERSKSKSRSRSSSRSRTRVDLISLETLSNPRLLDEIITSMEELYRYALGTEKLPNVEIAQHLKDRITKASELFLDRLVDEDTAERTFKKFEDDYNAIVSESLQEVERLRAKVFQIGKSLKGSIVEVRGKELTILGLEEDLKKSQKESNEIYNTLEYTVDRAEELERNYTTLVDGLRRNLEQITANRDYICYLYRVEQTTNRSLARQKFVLKLANRQLQNQLANIPAMPIVAPPQPVDQIWLVFQ